MEETRQHYNVTLGVLALAGLAYALQQTMILPALPSLQRDLHTTAAWATWLFTSFLLVSAVATPVLGKLGDQYGKERFLQRHPGGVVHYGFGLSPTLSAFVAAFWVSAAVAIVGAGLARLIPRNRPVLAV